MITVGIKAIPVGGEQDFAHEGCISREELTETFSVVLKRLIDLAEQMTGHQPAVMSLEISWLDADSAADKVPLTPEAIVAQDPRFSPFAPKGDRNVH